MQRFRTGVGALALLALLPRAASADRKAPPPAAERLAVYDCVIVGKVQSVEPKSVEALPYPGAREKVAFQVAVIKIEEAVTGAKGLTHLKVGFLPPGENVGLPHRHYPLWNLAAGQEACFFLQQHADQPFYVLPDACDLANKNDARFAPELAQAKKAAQLLADPAVNLQSKDAADRLLAAALLVARYRTPRPGSAKAEPVAAEESKLLLKALAEADWGKNDPQLYSLNARTAFLRLGLTPKDGWQPPKDFDQFEAAAKKWLTENADKYRIQRYVPDKPQK